jgi:hypothetical protein
MPRGARSVKKTIFAIVLMAGAALLGCGGSNQQPEGPAEKAGKSADNAGKDVKEGAKEAADDVGDATEKAGDKVEQKTDND